MITLPPPEIIEQFKNTTGAMSVSEGIALYNICLLAPTGYWMELGSHKGKHEAKAGSKKATKPKNTHAHKPESR